jgi:hypothetical protein
MYSYYFSIFLFFFNYYYCFFVDFSFVYLENNSYANNGENFLNEILSVNVNESNPIVFIKTKTTNEFEEAGDLYVKFYRGANVRPLVVIIENKSVNIEDVDFNPRSKNIVHKKKGSNINTTTCHYKQYKHIKELFKNNEDYIFIYMTTSTNCGETCFIKDGAIVMTALENEKFFGPLYGLYKTFRKITFKK